MGDLFWKVYEWRAVMAIMLILAIERFRGELKPVSPMETIAGIAFFIVATAGASWYVKARNLSCPRPL